MQHQEKGIILFMVIAVGDIPYSSDIIRTITISSRVAFARLIRSTERFSHWSFQAGCNNILHCKVRSIYKDAKHQRIVISTFIKYLKLFVPEYHNGWRISISYVWGFYTTTPDTYFLKRSFASNPSQYLWDGTFRPFLSLPNVSTYQPPISCMPHRGSKSQNLLERKSLLITSINKKPKRQWETYILYY